MLNQDILHGGLGDNKPDSSFDPKELSMGEKHETEHTDNSLIAKEIAKDHLSEDPKYYEKESLFNPSKFLPQSKKLLNWAIPAAAGGYFGYRGYKYMSQPSQAQQQHTLHPFLANYNQQQAPQAPNHSLLSSPYSEDYGSVFGTASTARTPISDSQYQQPYQDMYSRMQNPTFKASAMKDWTQLHHVLTRPPTLQDITKTTASLADGVLSKYYNRLRGFIPMLPEAKRLNIFSTPAGARLGKLSSSKLSAISGPIKESMGMEVGMGPGLRVDLGVVNAPAGRHSKAANMSGDALDRLADAVFSKQAVRSDITGSDEVNPTPEDLQRYMSSLPEGTDFNTQMLKEVPSKAQESQQVPSAPVPYQGDTNISQPAPQAPQAPQERFGMGVGSMIAGGRGNPPNAVSRAIKGLSGASGDKIAPQTPKATSDAITQPSRGPSSPAIAAAYDKPTFARNAFNDRTDRMMAGEDPVLAGQTPGGDNGGYKFMGRDPRFVGTDAERAQAAASKGNPEDYAPKTYQTSAPAAPQAPQAPAAPPQTLSRYYASNQTQKANLGTRQAYLNRRLNSPYINPSQRRSIQQELESISGQGKDNIMQMNDRNEGNTAESLMRSGHSPAAVAGWQGNGTRDALTGKPISTRSYLEHNSANQWRREQGMQAQENPYMPNSGAHPTLGVASKKPVLGQGVGGVQVAGGKATPMSNATSNDSMMAGQPKKLPMMNNPIGIPGSPLSKASRAEKMAFMGGLMRMGGKALGALGGAMRNTQVGMSKARMLRPLWGMANGYAMGSSADQLAGVGGYDTNGWGGTVGALTGLVARSPGMANKLNRLGSRFGMGGAGSTARKFFTDSGISGKPLGAASWVMGYGHSPISKLQAGLNWGSDAASGISHMAQERGTQAAFDTADQFAKNYGYSNVEDMMNSPAGKMFNAYNHFSSGLAGTRAPGVHMPRGAWSSIYN